MSPLGTGRSSVTGGVRRVVARTIGGLRTGSESHKTVWIPEKQRFSGLMWHRRAPAKT